MHEYLETLLPKFGEIFRSNVKITEVTVFSLQLSPKEALVMTNKQIYLLKKGFWGIKVHSFHLDEVELKITEDQLHVTSEKQGFNAVVKILDSRKMSILSMALKKFI